MDERPGSAAGASVITMVMRALAGRCIALRWALPTAIGVMLLLSARQAVDHFELVRELWGRSVAERGVFAADAQRTFLNRSGRVALRRALSASGTPPALSSTAHLWRWGFELSRTVHPEARVYVNVPATGPYFYASFFCYPAAVVVDTRGAPVTDGRSLREHGVFLDDASLRALRRSGYTHAVLRTRTGGISLVELPPGGGAP